MAYRDTVGVHLSWTVDLFRDLALSLAAEFLRSGVSFAMTAEGNPGDVRVYMSRNALAVFENWSFLIKQAGIAVQKTKRIGP